MKQTKRSEASCCHRVQVTAGRWWTRHSTDAVHRQHGLCIRVRTAVEQGNDLASTLEVHKRMWTREWM